MSFMQPTRRQALVLGVCILAPTTAAEAYAFGRILNVNPWPWPTGGAVLGALMGLWCGWASTHPVRRRR